MLRHDRGMNLFFDECVSPAAAIHFRQNSVHATCHPRDMNMSGAPDTAVLAYCVQIDHVLITINGRDFRKLCGSREVVHPGLIIIPSVSRARQIDMIETALALILREAPPESPQDWMVNRVVEVAANGAVTHASLPR